jgi:hypothetical protein
MGWERIDVAETQQSTAKLLDATPSPASLTRRNGRSKDARARTPRPGRPEDGAHV